MISKIVTARNFEKTAQKSFVSRTEKSIGKKST